MVNSADNIGLNLRLIRSSSILPHGSRSFAATAFLIRCSLPSHLLHCGLGQKNRTERPASRSVFQPFPAFLSRADLPPPSQPRLNCHVLHNVIVTKQSFMYKYFSAILPLHFKVLVSILCVVCNFLLFPSYKSDFQCPVHPPTPLSQPSFQPAATAGCGIASSDV